MRNPRLFFTVGRPFALIARANLEIQAKTGAFARES
jgi:hypothetical protein